MLNHVDIMGRMTRDPDLKTTASGVSVSTFSIAVDRDFLEGGERKADFVDCVAWRQTAEFAAKYFYKGSMVVVSGSLRSREWTDRDGNKRRGIEIEASNLYFGEHTPASSRE